MTPAEITAVAVLSIIVAHVVAEAMRPMGRRLSVALFRI